MGKVNKPCVDKDSHFERVIRIKCGHIRLGAYISFWHASFQQPFLFTTMVTISREQAICMCYCEAFNKLNVVKLSKLIDDMSIIEICYAEDSTEPMLLCQARINQNPMKCKVLFLDRKSVV